MGNIVMNTTHPAAEFIVAMFGPHKSGRVCITSLPNIADGKPDGAPIYTRSSKQIVDFITKHDRPGFGCFVCVNPIKDKATRRAEETVTAIICAHADIDFAKVEETPEEIERIIMALPWAPSRVHHSGHGLHLFWFLDPALITSPAGNTCHKQLLKRIAELLAGDPAACLIPQLMRLPGTTNSKNGEQHEVRVLSRPNFYFNPAILTATVGAIPAPLLHRKSPDPKPGSGNGASPDNPFLAYAAAHGEVPLDVDQLLTDMDYRGPGGGGNAHDTLLRCSAALLTSGAKREDVIARCLAALEAAAARHGLTIDPAREQAIIEEMCADWLKKHPEIHERESDERSILLPFINFAAWDDMPVPAMEWAVPDRYPIGHASLCSGDGGTGKSRTKLHMCVAHVLGREWLGVNPKPGPALFVDAEDDEHELHRRLAQILEHYDARFADAWAGGLRLVSLVGRDPVLGAPNRSGRIEPTKLYNELLQCVGDTRPVMTAIASSADVFAGNEIARDQVRQFIHLLNRLAIAARGGLVLIAHPSLTGINSGSGLSGSTQWHNAVRARSYLQHVKPNDDEEEPDPDLRMLEFKKNNYGPVSESIYLRYQNGLFLPEHGASAADRAAREEAADAVIINQLKRNDMNLSNNLFAHNYAPRIMVKMPEARNQGLTKRDLEEAMNRLLAAGKIRVERYGRPADPRFRLVVV
jgi:RecA-family ATPase